MQGGQYSTKQNLFDLNKIYMRIQNTKLQYGIENQPVLIQERIRIVC